MSKKNKKKKKGIAFFSRAKSATPEPMVAEEVTAAEMPAAGDSGVTVVPAGAFDYLNNTEFIEDMNDDRWQPIDEAFAGLSPQPKPKQMTVFD